MTKYYVGEKVLTPKGKGKISYWRMKATDSSQVESVSVLLDDKIEERLYSGTMFPDEEIIQERD